MANTKNLEQQSRRRITLRSRLSAQSGQALVEYALILVLVVVAAGITLAATGPAMANIFSNVIYNIIGQDQANLEWCPNPEAPTNPNVAPVPCVLAQGQAVAFWQTVEFIRNNPQQETPYPTPIDLPERSEEADPNVNTPTFTYTYTRTNTYTPSATFTPTSTYSYTPGAPPTPDDVIFEVPHADLSDKHEWWRLDNTFGIGDGQWNVTYYEGENYDGTAHPTAEYMSSNGFIQNLWDDRGPGEAPTSVGGFPVGDTNFSAIYSKSFYVPFADDPVDISFTIATGDSLEIWVIPPVGAATLLGGGPFIASDAFTHIFDPGQHTLEIKYRDTSGDAQLFIDMVRQHTNPDDDSTACAWLNIDSDLHSDSPTSVWDENADPNLANWPSGQTCILELRGAVDITGVPSPRLSWWDVWDFSNNPGVTAELQVANYVTNPEGFFNRGSAVWQSLGTRSGGTANYNWTRNQVDLSGMGLGPQVTFRFVITSAATGNVRWNIDDIQVLSDPELPPFTVGKEWSLDTRDQMADFIFNGDANYTRSVTGGSMEGWRWDLTGTNARSGNGWDISPGGSFIQSAGSVGGTGGPQERVAYLEIRHPINLTGTLPPDTEGDDGDPMLSFWQAYDIPAGSSLEVQYTTDLRSDSSGTPDNWITIPSEGLLLSSSEIFIPSVTEPNLATARTNLTMHRIEVRLSLIPGWNTQLFRLRFAMITAPLATANDWYIDEIRLEREDGQIYEGYPMMDNAENTTAAAKRWSAVGSSGVWQSMTPVGSGYRSSARAFADSPSGDYATGEITAMEMRRTLDLLNDTPDNGISNGEDDARPAAVDPQLSFMWRGQMQGIAVLVDVWVARTNQWQEIWRYDTPTSNFGRIQNAWERVEIDLQQALAELLRLATGDLSWHWGDPSDTASTSIVGNGISDDDDIRVRIRLNTSGGTARDGIYVDNIRIGENESYVHKLWGAAPCGTCSTVSGAGDYDFTDDIETRTPNLGSLNDTWIERWYAGGSWDVNTVAARNGAYSITESPTGNYSGNSIIYLELKPIIDLRGTDPAFVPSVDFFTRYNIGDGDTLRIQISQENTGDTTQGYNNLVGWGNWNDATLSQPGTPTRIETWFLSRVDLSSYIGNRIRIRFVLVTDGTTESDGQYIDAVKISTGMQTFTHAMANIFENTFSYPPDWIFDGNWGVTQQYVSANNTDSWYLGAPWDGFFYNCDACNASSFYDDLNFWEPTGLLLDDTSPLELGLMPDTPSFDVVEWLDTGRPQPQPGYGPGYIPGAEWDDSWAGRWVRDVTLTAGQTYRVYAISNDGVLLEVDDATDINGIPSNGQIINDWGNHGPRLTYTTFTVSSGTDINRTLRLSYYEGTGTAVLSLNIISSSAYSATDSPNTPGGTVGQGDNTLGYNLVPSPSYGYGAITLNGMIDLTGTSDPQFIYERYYDITNSSFRLQFSADGGFTWNDMDDNPTGGSVLPPSNWQTRTVPIPLTYQTEHFTFRFLLNTISAAPGTTGDGVWIGSVVIRE